jgi:hypothetical protein
MVIVEIKTVLIHSILRYLNLKFFLVSNRTLCANFLICMFIRNIRF